VSLGSDEELKVGTSRFVALETPGHTPESISYAVYLKDAGDKCWGLFTGDALFVGDTGRTDLPDPEKIGENAGILYDSIHRKIAPLGDHTLLYPAHEAGSACGGNISERDDSTLGIEKGTSPVFRKSRRDLVAHKLAEKMARPPYFLHMEKVNLLHGRPLKWPSTLHLLQPSEFQHRMKEGLVIDPRAPEAFSGAHIPGAYSIWLDGVPAFGGWIANENTWICLVADGPEAMDLAVMSLARIGIDTVEGILANGIEGWRDQGLPLESIATTGAAETSNWMQQGRVHVLDVRDEYEWDKRHIPGAVHRYVGYLEDNLPLLPKDSEIVVHCNVTRVHNMLGGITAWEKPGLPFERPGGAKMAD
jgi:hydroxyacylglutathione hydrolase